MEYKGAAARLGSQKKKKTAKNKIEKISNVISLLLSIINGKKEELLLKIYEIALKYESIEIMEIFQKILNKIELCKDTSLLLKSIKKKKTHRKDARQPVSQPLTMLCR